MNSLLKKKRKKKREKNQALEHHFQKSQMQVTILQETRSDFSRAQV